MGGLRMKISFDDLFDVYEDYIRKGYSNKRKLYNFEVCKVVKLYELCNLVNNGDYSMDNYNIFLITRPKVRIVMSLSLKDKIINHYVTLRYIMPVLERYLDNRNVATRKGYGIDYGIRLVNKYIEKNKKYGRFYVLKLDISKYFYNIDHEVLKSLIRDKFDSDVYDFLGYRFRVINGKTVRKVSGRSFRNVSGNIRRCDVGFGSFNSYMNYCNSYKLSDNRCICNYLIDHFGA